MSKDLYVGDLHVQPKNLEESQRLADFIVDTFKQNKCDRIVFLGDIFHTHSVVMQQVAYLMVNFFKGLLQLVGGDKNKIIVLAGNHDGISPTVNSQNAIELILSDYAKVISSGFHVDAEGYVYLPFMADQEEFIKRANTGFSIAESFDKKHPVLVCHQTFNGAAYESGMLCPGGVDSQALPFTQIISGHIHKRQLVNGKVYYLGTPRAVTAGEVNEEKYIFIIEKDEILNFTPISTKDIVRNYYSLKINEGDLNLPDLENMKEICNPKDDLRITVTGSQQFYESVLSHYKSHIGKVKFIPNIRKDLSKKINIEATNMSIESALEKYIKEVADLDQQMKEDVWKIIANSL